MNCPGCGALILSDDGPPEHEGTLTPHPRTGELYHASCLEGAITNFIEDEVGRAEHETVDLPPVPVVPVPIVPPPAPAAPTT